MSSSSAAVNAGHVDPSLESTMSSTLTGKALTVSSLQDTFTSFHKYVEAESKISQEQWRFFALCNEKVGLEFEEVSKHATAALGMVGETNAIIANALPEGFVLDLEQLEANLDALETIAKGLEEYSFALERRYL